MSERFSGICLVVSDPELRYTGHGTAVCHLRVKHEEIFYGLDIWEPGAWFESSQDDWPVEQFPKGSLVAVEGALKTRTYTRQDGAEGTSTDITAWAVGPVWRRPRRDAE